MGAVVEEQSNPMPPLERQLRSHIELAPGGRVTAAGGELQIGGYYLLWQVSQTPLLLSLNR